jgi:hypothetical protein
VHATCLVTSKTLTWKEFQSAQPRARRLATALSLGDSPFFLQRRPIFIDRLCIATRRPQSPIHRRRVPAPPSAPPKAILPTWRPRRHGSGWNSPDDAPAAAAFCFSAASSAAPGRYPGICRRRLHREGLHRPTPTPPRSLLG